jgi:hypothetical protein
LIAIAFHDSLWSAFTAGPLTTAALVSLTLGAGVVVSLASAALLLARALRPVRFSVNCSTVTIA